MKLAGLGGILLCCFALANPAAAQSLQDAAGDDDVETVVELIAAGEDVNARDSIGFTALHWAARFGGAEAASVLIDAGALLDARSKEDEAPLHTAAHNDEVEVAKLLLRAGADVNAPGAGGNSPLHTALRASSLGAIELLIDAGAELDSRDRFGATPLHIAASHGDSWNHTGRTLVALLEAGADLEARDNFGYTPLHRALMDFEEGMFTDNPDTLAVLLEAGADVHALADNGCGVLQFAAVERADRSTEVLLDAGAAVGGGGVPDGVCQAPLVHALLMGADDVALLLMERGADIGIRDSDGHGMLTIALARGLGDVVHRLIRRDETLATNAENPELLVRTAIWADAADTLGKLEGRGIDIDDVGSSNRAWESLLHLAATRDSHEVTPWILGKGAGVNGGDAGGDPPLLVAVRHEAARVARLLIKEGADVDLVDDEGRTLLALAVESHHDGATEVSAPHRQLIAALLARRETIEANVGDSLLLSRAALQADAPLEFSQVLQQGAEASMDLGDAIRHGSLRLVAWLIENGADVNARDGSDWTLLHEALLAQEVSMRENVDAALMLIEAGAEVNVATAAIGWTPLHLAADLNRPEVAEALLRRGARVNARTHLGGWTPLLVAKRRSDGAEEVAAVLRRAGGVATAREKARRLPVYSSGRWFMPDPPPPHAPHARYQAIQDSLYATPRRGFAGGGGEERGSFTSANADERLIFESIGVVAYDVSHKTLVALVTEDGASVPVLATDHYIDYKGLCLDPVTNTHTAVFQRAYDGSCCPEEHMVYMHYSAAEGTLVESFVDDDLTNSSAWPKEPGGECPWREKQAMHGTFGDLMRSVRVGRLAGLDADGTSELLPTRILAASEVETQLARLEELPGDVAHTWSVDSPRWQAMVVEFSGYPASADLEHPCKSALLVREKSADGRGDWRSLYDCAVLVDTEIHGDRLSTALVSSDCGIGRLGRLCYLEIDLTTGKARLWDEPEGNYWQGHRERPDGASDGAG